VVVLGIAGVVVGVIVVGRAVDLFAEAPDDAYDLVLTSCTTSRSGTPEMEMRITNRSGERRRFRILAGYFSDGRQVGVDRIATTTSLADGQTERLTLQGGQTPPIGFTCRVIEVRYHGN
jgi:hypothetical protein